MMQYAGLSVREALARTHRVLGRAGVETPGVDARLLVAGALQATSLDLLREPLRLLGSEEAERLVGFVVRRKAREPVSRILGSRGFYGRDFRITPATLDPRPCSETLIDAALEIIRREGRGELRIRILDIGTGSGCLLLTLLAELPEAEGVGTDISSEALDAARENARLLGLGERAKFRQCRFFEGVEETFDLLISNPPYIAQADIPGLEAEVRLYDPAAALDGGPDGLSAYRELAKGLSRAVPRGWGFFEVGAGQAEDVAGILRAAGRELDPASLRVWNDLGGHGRCVAVKTQSYP